MEAISRNPRHYAISPLRSVLMLVLDGLISASALSFAMALRFDFRSIPAAQVQGFKFGLPVLISLRIVLSLLAGLHRWSFRMSGLHEAVRIGATVAVGSVAYVSTLHFLGSLTPPRSVTVLEFFFTTGMMLGYRFAPRASSNWVRRIARPRMEGFQRTLIVGAGSAGDLLLRDLDRSDAHNYMVVGFVDDDLSKRRSSIGGRPVLGNVAALSGLVAKHRITKVLIAIPHLPGARVREILASCAQAKVGFKIIPASFTYLDEKVTAAMLHDVSPEDLLPREAITFDPLEVQGLIKGRRVMITGAGGSIGSEIARQVAGYGAEQLILVDMNENELYFLARNLLEKYPQMKVEALVADIRDAAQMLYLGEKFRPQDIFHAAAHKHVPLMEDMPAEAVKNNVFGTLNVASMADSIGAERFILISTDKAVRPTSVMGASKRVAETLVRDLAHKSKTRFTAVRFGNVLGSAGSVVPLFKQQIERGGPVTVTHPDCTRFFMTIPEAVGLVLIAGLGKYGELCILDMGEAIRIADLAANMITMAGLVPNVDIPIVFTGLRPGEKLYEELFTEEEEESHVVRNKILVAKSIPAPKELARWLEELRHAAATNDHESIIDAFRAIVPSYQPAGRAKPSVPTLKLVKAETKANFGA